MGEPEGVLTAIAAVFQIVDSLTGQWDRFLQKSEKADKDPNGSHKVTTERTQPDTIIVKKYGSVVDTITAADIAKLDPNSRRLIEVYEQVMARQYDLWLRVYPQREQSTDPVVNAQIEQKLEDILRKMCAELEKIFRHLDSIGKHLNDHYSHARDLCGELKQKSLR